MTVKPTALSASQAGPPQSSRAVPPRAPVPTGLVERTEAIRREQIECQKAVERRRMLRGLLWLSLTILLASMVRAGWDRVFVPGWWRQW